LKKENQAIRAGAQRLLGGVQALAREYTPRAVETLRGIMENIKACPQQGSLPRFAILDRGYGRPHQTSEIVTVQKPVSEMSDEEIIARIRELQKTAALPALPLTKRTNREASQLVK
jgi:hypothetical protein